MRAVVCRVKKTTLEVNQQLVSTIDQGLLVYLGITQSDTLECVDKMVKKIINLRIFEDQDEKMNLKFDPSIHQIMLVSQFTLYGDVTNNHRPSFTKAASKEIALPLYQAMTNQFKALGVRVENGIFGAHMMINAIYDGPVNLLIEFDA